jgi:hypothetical protein
MPMNDQRIIIAKYNKKSNKRFFNDPIIPIIFRLKFFEKLIKKKDLITRENRKLVFG